MQLQIEKDFMKSARKLQMAGGQFRNAAERALAICSLIREGDNEPFMGLVTRNENRIRNCRKYQLPGACRLITIQSGGLCIFCYVGNHDDCQTWLNRNRGLTPIVRENRIEMMGKSKDTNLILTYGKLYQKLPENYIDKIFQIIPEDISEKFKQLETINTDDDIIILSSQIDDPETRDVVFYVFCSLRDDDVKNAKLFIDTYHGAAHPIDELTDEQIENCKPGEELIDITNFDPQLFEHYITTANYQDWMLFLHPEQRKIIDKNFNGPARLLGVSGTGKTCIIIKRAIRLAKLYPNEKILVLTINRSLAKLINDLINYACPDGWRDNIKVSSFWELCREELNSFMPQDQIEKLYNDETWKLRESVHSVWDEYYRCRLNNFDAEVLHIVHDSLLARKIYPSDYIYQEFDYIRSIYPLNERENYLNLPRVGRAIEFNNRFRKKILNGLKSWEEKMKFVGVIDYLGLAATLYNYIDQIESKYRCILVDEIQDFGTLELIIIRKLVSEEENDIFLCGDIAQKVGIKHNNFKMAGINIVGRGCSLKIIKNYRNSREILDAAYEVLKNNLNINDLQNDEFEFLEPELANFSSSKPLILKAGSVKEEFASSLSFFKNLLSLNQNNKLCIIFSGYLLNDIKKIGDAYNLPVLDGNTNLSDGNIFLSTLEDAKGFEFDKVCILNCKKDVIPDSSLPTNEWYRDLTKLYVAMTRAKNELIISYSDEYSSFFKDAITKFNHSEWKEHVDNIETAEMDEISMSSGKYNPSNNEILNMTGRDFLYTQKAVGILKNLSEKLCRFVKETDEYEQANQTWSTMGELFNCPYDTVVQNRFRNDYNELQKLKKEILL